jgi:hypothetical protein
VIIGPPWFGAGVGGGNWRVIPNRTPFGPPGALETHLLDGDLCDFDAVHSARAALAAAPPFEPVPVCSGFPCEVYTCRLGTNTTHASTLAVPQGRRRERVRAPALLQAAGRLRRDRVSRVGPAQAEPSEDGQAVRLRAPLAVAGRADRRHSGLDQRHRAQAIEAGVRRTTPGPRVLGVKSDSTYKVLDRIARAYSEKRFLVVYENARYRTTSTRDTQRRSTKGVRRRHLFTPPSRKARARPWP